MSTVKFDTWQNTDGTENYKCRAWCKFDGTAADITATMTGGNVSSITDMGVGVYKVNFTNAMPDVNYTVSATNSPIYALNGPAWCVINGDKSSWTAENSPTTTSFYVGPASSSGYYDAKYVNIAVFR